MIDLARHITDLITATPTRLSSQAARRPRPGPLEPQDVDRGVRSTARKLDRAEEDALLPETVVGRADATPQQVGDLVIEADDPARRLREHEKRALTTPAQRGPAKPCPMTRVPTGHGFRRRHTTRPSTSSSTVCRRHNAHSHRSPSGSTPPAWPKQ